jgi:hypothetical protein
MHSDSRDSRLSARLIGLLIYQWILVTIALAYSAAGTVAVWGEQEPLVPLLALLVLACWGTAMGVAALGVRRRRPREILLGMVCHLLLAIPGGLAIGTLGFMFVATSLNSSHDARAWAPLFLLFALMWLPFVLLSAWAFFYLRRLRAAVAMEHALPKLS